LLGEVSKYNLYYSLILITIYLETIIIIKKVITKTKKKNIYIYFL
jgi:hypothetical protein